MAEKKLSVDLGLVTFSVNGKCNITFNPTDTAFVERFYAAFEELDKRQESYKAEIERTSNTREIFETARRLDEEMRGLVDGVLGKGVSEAVFGFMNLYAMANGLPVWANLMLGVLDEIDDSFNREQKLTDARVKKYTSKYHR